MPLFEFKCSKCGAQFEKFQKFANVTDVACESCGGSTERVVSSSNFALKGSGWASDGYK